MTWLLVGMVATGAVLLVLAMMTRRDDRQPEQPMASGFSEPAPPPAPPADEQPAARPVAEKTLAAAPPPPATPAAAVPAAQPVDPGGDVVSALTILAARPGDRLVIAGAAEDGGDVEFKVRTRHRYEADGEEWFEVAGKCRGRQVYVEAYEDNGLEVLAILDPRSLKLSDLGITEDELIRMDEEQSEDNSIEFDNHAWHYACSEEAFFFENGKGKPEGFYAWDFSEDTGERLIGIEKWEDEDFEICISQRINPADITVYRA